MAEELDKEIKDLIRKQMKRIKEVIQSCALYMHSDYDVCNMECAMYKYCWDLQDEDKRIGNGIHHIVSIEGEE